MFVAADLLSSVKGKGWHTPQWLAWALLGLWAVVWIPFSLLAGLLEIGDLGVLALLSHLVLPALIVAVLWLCWRWPVLGAACAVLAACALTLWYGFHNWLVVVLLDLPPLLAGILLIVAWITYHPDQPAEP